ncbi:MAG: hypothetical protein HWN51_03910 [Desulfobacterales bacterium]|nr:hypothetical protein [Desulfobacterales bacterium]
MMNIPYSRETDPNAIVIQGLQNMISGILYGQQRKRQIGDIRDVGQYITGGFEGETPSPITQFGQEMLSRALLGQAQRQFISPSQMISQERLRKYFETSDPSWIQPGLTVRAPFEATDLTGAGLADYKSKLRDKKTEEEIKPMPDSELKAARDVISKSVKRARRGILGRPGRTDYPKEKLLEQFEIYKRKKGYSALPDNQKRQLWEIWVDSLREVGGRKMHEVGFDPTDPDWIKASELQAEKEEDIGADSIKLQTAPDIDLNPYWPAMDDEVKKKVWQAYEQGHPIEDIISALRTDGIIK